VSIRLRLTALFALAAAGLFALGSYSLTSLLSSNLISSLDANLTAQATQAAQALPGPSGQENLQDSGGVPVGKRPLSSPGVPSEYLVQIFGPTGRLIQSNEAAGAAPLLGRAAVARARRSGFYLTSSRPGSQEQLRLLAAPISGQLGSVVVVGQSLETTSETLSSVERALVIAGLVSVALAAGAAYLLARAALRPVERMRRHVEVLADDRPDALAVGVVVPSTGDELAALARTMNGLLSRLAGSLEQRSAALERERSLVADAGHELRTPLAVLRGELELASRPGRTRAELALAVTSALGETDHVARLAEDLLILAARDGGELTCAAEPVRVRALLERSAEAALAEATRHHVTIEVVADGQLEALVDPGRIRQVLDNLLDNALRYAPAGSAVAMSAVASGTTLSIRIADQGPGFPVEFLPRAFERFARADAARGRDTGGTGLGLAIVASIAAAHGGRAAAANSPGGGAVVTVEIPDAVIGPAVDCD